MAVAVVAAAARGEHRPVTHVVRDAGRGQEALAARHGVPDDEVRACHRARVLVEEDAAVAAVQRKAVTVDGIARVVGKKRAMSGT